MDTASIWRRSLEFREYGIEPVVAYAIETATSPARADREYRNSWNQRGAASRRTRAAHVSAWERSVSCFCGAPGRNKTAGQMDTHAHRFRVWIPFRPVLPARWTYRTARYRRAAPAHISEKSRSSATHPPADIHGSPCLTPGQSEPSYPSSLYQQVLSWLSINNCDRASSISCIGE